LIAPNQASFVFFERDRFCAVGGGAAGSDGAVADARFF
jgi:hypothetical protein